ncbi:uncharacterized protein LOC125540925 [Triticum urartu]|uniref:uncharacterized protein LOC125540925 n=1 Tax=Triticum urartu TaxID=4572 RepID=UPI00204374F0|nr:uncharacterized protein LOC125540925 [Triticum urartu]
MVSWSEDSGSSEGSHGRYYQYATSGSDDGIVQIPATTDDSEFEGKDYVLCHEHRKRAERLVAFEGIHTGRRFLACAVKVCVKFLLISCCGLIIWSLFSTYFGI